MGQVFSAFPSATSESQASSVGRDMALSQVRTSAWSSPPVSSALAPHLGFLPYHLIPQKLLLPETKISWLLIPKATSKSSSGLAPTSPQPCLPSFLNWFPLYSDSGLPSQLPTSDTLASCECSSSFAFLPCCSSWGSLFESLPTPHALHERAQQHSTLQIPLHAGGPHTVLQAQPFH